MLHNQKRCTIISGKLSNIDHNIILELLSKYLSIALAILLNTFSAL